MSTENLFITFLIVVALSVTTYSITEDYLNTQLKITKLQCEKSS